MKWLEKKEKRKKKKKIKLTDYGCLDFCPIKKIILQERQVDGSEVAEGQCIYDDWRLNSLLEPLSKRCR